MEEENILVGVMGVQDKEEVALIRHAYVRTNQRNNGVGGSLLSHLLELTAKPVLIGTWETAEWAIGFYRKHGFSLVSQDNKEKLLSKFWNVPKRQVETSVVLSNDTMYL